ncbi:MAG: co-chaperone DjlA [Gammaproteobacteria bacterium]
MSWWGKVAGGAFGFMLGGPLGALFGAAMGHQFDRGLKLDHENLQLGSQEKIQAAFFTATFSVMGHIAKADGQVTDDEIQIAKDVMAQMSLTPEQTKAAQELFNTGKTSDFDYIGIITQFSDVCGRRTNLLRMFMELQFHAAYADGAVHSAERAILEDLNKSLGFDKTYFAQLEAAIRMQRTQASNESPRSRQQQLSDAYQMLGMSSDATDADIKKAYRRLMSQHHPDKLVAKGLPDEMMQVATQKTQEIKAAYELIKESRKSN